jgi:hypothetical protein
MGRPASSNSIMPAASRSDARSELAHHHFDLQLHALLMFVSGLLAACFGLFIVDLDRAAIPDEATSGGMPLELLSGAALVIFLGMSVFCLLEALRCWRKATAISVRTGRAAVRPSTRQVQWILHSIGLFSRRQFRI